MSELLTHAVTRCHVAFVPQGIRKITKHLASIFLEANLSFWGYQALVPAFDIGLFGVGVIGENE